MTVVALASSKASSASSASRPVSEGALRARRLKKERTHAKNAMVASLGAVMLTGMLASHGKRRDTKGTLAGHIVASVALLGTCYWHATLYGPQPKGASGSKGREP